MSIAITDDHRVLADTAADFLTKRDTRGQARALLEAREEPLPDFWDDLRALGWLGLHVPEAHGGSGYGMPELVVVVEELGRALTPGPFVPSVIASAVLAAALPSAVAEAWLPRLASGDAGGAGGLGGAGPGRGGQATRDARGVLGGGPPGGVVGGARGGGAGVRGPGGRR